MPDSRPLSRFLGSPLRQYKVVAYNSCLACNGLGMVKKARARSTGAYLKIMKDVERISKKLEIAKKYKEVTSWLLAHGDLKSLEKDTGNTAADEAERREEREKDIEAAQKKLEDLKKKKPGDYESLKAERNALIQKARRSIPARSEADFMDAPCEACGGKPGSASGIPGIPGSGIGKRIDENRIGSLEIGDSLPPDMPGARQALRATGRKLNIKEWHTSGDAIDIAKRLINKYRATKAEHVRTFEPEIDLPPDLASTPPALPISKPDDFARICIIKAPDTMEESARIVFDWVKGEQVWPKRTVAESLSHVKFVNEMAVATGAIAAPPGGYKTTEGGGRKGRRKHKGAVILGGLRDDYNWHPSPGKMLIADVKKGDLVSYDTENGVKQGIAAYLKKDYLIVRSEGQSRAVTHEDILSYKRHAVEDEPDLMSRIEGLFESFNSPVIIDTAKPIAWKPGMDFIGYIQEQDESKPGESSAAAVAGAAAAKAVAAIPDTASTGKVASAENNARKAALAADAAAKRGEAKEAAERKKAAEKAAKAIADELNPGA